MGIAVCSLAANGGTCGILVPHPLGEDPPSRDRSDNHVVEPSTSDARPTSCLEHRTLYRRALFEAALVRRRARQSARVVSAAGPPNMSD